MKQTIIYACMLTLSLCGLVGCNGMSKSSGSDADSIVADSQASTLIEDETKEAQSDAPTLDVTKYWAQFQEMYQEGDLDDIHETLTKYAFIDIDEDGIQEVWLRSENDEDGAIFCFDDEEEPVLITAETEGKRPSVGKGWVGVGFPAGGPSYFNHYVIIKDSQRRLSSPTSKWRRTMNITLVTPKSLKLRQRKSKRTSRAKAICQKTLNGIQNPKSNIPPI